jgi:4-diphosphocytidyl-2-C-methyl-D-erythritol kinase
MRLPGPDCPAPAKLNLFLHVVGRRADGYHLLQSAFALIDRADRLRFAVRDDGRIARVNDVAGIAAGDDLAVRAARRLQQATGTSLGADIELEKEIPVGGGLGGGSSDAAAVLMGLDRLWRLGLGPAGLHPLAQRLGADVPFFLIGGTALGLARGDEVFPLHRQVRAEVVVVDPERPLSTAEVFQRLDASLTPRENTNKIFRFVSSDLAEEGSAFPILSNDLERPALEVAPDLSARVDLIRGILVREGALMASLSGSGASYFGLFDDPVRARRAQKHLAARGLTALRSRTLSLDRYRRQWTLPAVGRARG